LVIKKIHLKNKKVQGKLSSKLNFNGFPPSRVVQIHEIMGQSLKMLIREMESENATLKDRIKELYNTLIPPPIFVNPIDTMQP
jgi:hypothetical protein